MVDRINKIQQNQPQQKSFPPEYRQKQQQLANSIKQPNSVADLERNAQIKREQINLARQYGDFQLAGVLQSELANIYADINRNQSSIFAQTRQNSMPKDYMQRQMALRNSIVQPQSVDDLRSNAKIKQEQIDLAKKYGDFGMAGTLQAELDNINFDISKNEG